MSNREKCIAILNEIAEDQLVNIAVILEAAKKAIDEAADAYSYRSESTISGSGSTEQTV